MRILKLAKMGNPILRKKAKLIAPEDIQKEEIQQLIKDMHTTLEDSGGIGLAAPQVHHGLQLAIIDVHGNQESEGVNKVVFINPEIKVLDKKVQGHFEGCLSIPGLTGYVERPRAIKVDFLDEKGKKQQLRFSGFLATVVQHELDHLQGTLYIDHIKDTKLLFFNEEFQKFGEKI